MFVFWLGVGARGGLMGRRLRLVVGRRCFEEDVMAGGPVEVGIGGAWWHVKEGNPEFWI